ncbi:MAG: NADH-quinone oxidoreductase subunit L, partial [Anaerolineae bacterium]
GEVDRRVGAARYARFFAFVSLFATGMLGFVLSSNLLEAIVFWEIMGLCSFLLIGFWYHKPSAAAAAQKAFLTTRIGDTLMLMGAFGLYWVFGTLDYDRMLSPTAGAVLSGLGASPLFGVPWATVLALLLFGGAIGKSAQFPLHVWLPDAMEGPTPVSALIHAATMVAAGVFLVARLYPVFNALFASTIAVAQFDIKRVLAYSTVSQLGYMIMALGIGAWVAAVFHLITHAFFKALLFLGSGSVIHGVEHGMHHAVAHGDAPAGAPAAMGTSAAASDPGDPQDMRNMGGLRTRMPLTFWSFLAGTLALTGIPVFAGFWSKDEILADAFHKGLGEGIAIAGVVWVFGTVAAFFTAFYMARQVYMVFGGPPSTPGARHAPESAPAMVYSLLFLAFFAIVLGFAGVPETLPGLGPALGNPFHHFVGRLSFGWEPFVALAFNPSPALMSVAVALAGWALGWAVYGRDPAAARTRDPLMRLGAAWTLLNRKYYVDEIYSATAIKGTVAFASLNRLLDTYVVDLVVNTAGRAGNLASVFNGWIDTQIVDGAVNLVGVVNGELSRGLRRIQTGRVQQYVLVVFVSVLALVGALVF